MTFRQSHKLDHVLYEIRGPVIEHANALEEAGHSVLRLNTGNPALFGFEAPEGILEDLIRNLPQAHGYTDSRGILPARQAVAGYYQQRGLSQVRANDVFLGNGVSELVSLAVHAFLDDGDEVLIPAPDYPLWTATVTLAGGRAVHYLCDEATGWLPDLDDVAAKITERTKALVIINPNNPTGAVYPRAVLEGIARLAERSGLVVFSDEIYDQMLYDGSEFVPMATLVKDTLCATLSGLSKVYRACGYRVGWVSFSGRKSNATEYFSALELLSSLRLCSNVPAQWAVQTALGGYQSIKELVSPGGRLYESRRAIANAVATSRYLDVQPMAGAMYAFIGVKTEELPDFDDQQFAALLLVAHTIPAHDLQRAAKRARLLLVARCITQQQVPAVGGDDFGDQGFCEQRNMQLPVSVHRMPQERS